MSRSRWFLAPRQLALHALALALVAIMIWLGSWQLDRARSAAEPAQTAEPPRVGIDRVSVRGQALPGDAYGRRVTVTGSYDPDAQTLVPDKEQDGRRGLWVLTPLRMSGGDALTVVRGWVPTADDAAPADVTSGRVTVAGRVYPSEDATAESAADLPAGQLAAVDPLALAQGVRYDLRDGYVVATDQQPAADDGLRAVPARPWQSHGAGFPLQNAAYALQWWLFALFVVFMWWRIIRERWRGTARVASESSADQPESPSKV